MLHSKKLRTKLFTEYKNPLVSPYCEKAMFSIYRTEDAMSPVKETWENADLSLRRAILQASRLLDRQLQDAPAEQGESREGGQRILFQAPLAVLFEVDQQRQEVHILRGWTYRCNITPDQEI